ncbi:Leucine-specific-binding protein [Defluviimonas aquaemixtae]|uniref:Leucine-specific-binding protein n=1 Tax=Albidovulum aquaemixtae TaxID=1542388 RepID=A0A2R8B2L9_9RHOB|nr:ABC transporter substrate-binding protein [Defluviimonas aquaemixtae]SPH16871.1 Leucine-specific-binding protein [Defluviimonas aquaemixtae]
MQMNFKSRSAFFGATIAASAAMTGAWALDTGVTDSTIRIGTIGPFTGPAASYSMVNKTDEAYMDMLNAEGGVCGRQIELVAYDDAYSPPKTLAAAKKLVEEDGVFLIYSTIGTATNSAIREYLNEQEVPHIFVSSGASKWGHRKEFPWTMGFHPPYTSEAKIYAKYILDTYPDGRIGILFQDDEFGKDFVNGLRAGLGEKADEMIVSEQPYVTSDPDVDAQIANFKESGADIVLYAAIPKFAGQAISNAQEIEWKPTQFVVGVGRTAVLRLEPAAVEAAKGMITAHFTKVAQDPKWSDDEGMQKWNAFMDEYYPEGDKGHSATIVGYGVSQALEHVLKAACDNLTRAGVMEAVSSMQNVELDVLLPGITLNTSETDSYPIEQMQLMRFDGERWELFGEVIDAWPLAMKN